LISRIPRVAALFTLLSTLFCGAALAACPGDAGEPLPPLEKLPALEQELSGLAAECSGQAGYLAYRGAALNALGRPGEAAPLLEQALLIDPQRAGAQIDYAEALAALGDTSAAAALLREVLTRTDVPATLRSPLERRLNALDALTRADALTSFSGLRAWVGTGWQGGGSLTLRLGRDSNLNSAPSRDSLNLTLAGGDVVLLLADRFRARAGAAGLVEASGQVARPLEGGAALQFYGEARVRNSPSESDTRYEQLQAVVARSQPLADGEALFSFGATQLRYGGADLYHALRLAAGRDWGNWGNWEHGTCRPRLGIEAESRRYPVAPELEGRFLGVGAGLACSLGPDRLTLAGRSGQDTPQANRPGGEQRHSDLRLTWARPLGNGRLQADLLWNRQQDAGGYSPLLEDGATRRLSRTSLRVEYAYPLAPAWTLLASLEGMDQRSNLALFDVSGRALYLGLRWTSIAQ
jgi:tetratricopeptide (TPR) repeat protein